ncbi:MAG TPA: cytochrome c peroxidase, partial [Kofleriaceae bacterium]
GRPFDCNGAARLGQQLFFEPLLSGPIVDGKPVGKTSCSTCHASSIKDDPGWYIDIRQSNAVSQGASSPTPHNTLSLVNVEVGSREWFGWTGQSGDKPCNTANDVVNKIALPKAMQSTPAIVGTAIRSPAYLATYTVVFGVNAPIDDTSVEQNVELALAAYMRRLVSLEAPFDAFIRGDDAAISDEAKRGFALFVGRAMCGECHRGGTFSDDTFHVTGVEDAAFDAGHFGTGGFYTSRLRNVEKTAPYMHKGTLATLGDVIEFYRWGGSQAGYTGERDPLMQPFELDDADAKDLEAFLRTLTGKPIPTELRKDTHAAQACSVPNSTNQGLVCDGACRDVVNDPMYCGNCTTKCATGGYCMGGVCGP